MYSLDSTTVAVSWWKQTKDPIIVQFTRLNVFSSPNLVLKSQGTPRELLAGLQSV